MLQENTDLKWELEGSTSPSAIYVEIRTFELGLRIKWQLLNTSNLGRRLSCNVLCNVNCARSTRRTACPEEVVWRLLTYPAE